MSEPAPTDTDPVETDHDTVSERETAIAIDAVTIERARASDTVFSVHR